VLWVARARNSCYTAMRGRNFSPLQKLPERLCGPPSVIGRGTNWALREPDHWAASSAHTAPPPSAIYYYGLYRDISVWYLYSKMPGRSFLVFILEESHPHGIPELLGMLICIINLFAYAVLTFMCALEKCFYLKFWWKLPSSDHSPLLDLCVD
jgi:hypothetical protein